MATVEDIFHKLNEIFPEKGLELAPNSPEAIVVLPRELIRDLCLRLRDDSAFGFRSLTCITGIERAGGLEAAYSLYSNALGSHLNLRVKVTFEDAIIPSVMDIWPAADWHEREIYDMFGILFEGHRDLRRILTPDDWEGHPLRKDYKPPEFWHEIPVTVNAPMGK